MKDPLTVIGLCLLAAAAAQGVESDKSEVPISESDMSIYASEASLQDFLSMFPMKAYLTFPEVREKSIRILDGIPEVWTRRSRKELTAFEGNARPGEFFTFQVGVYAARETLRNVKVAFSALKGATLIDESALNCFNLEGVDHLGRSFKKTVDVAEGRIQPLWLGVSIPVDARGQYRGRLTISPENAVETEIDLVLNVAGATLSHRGVDEAARFARLCWLNSTIAHDDEVTRGYIPVSRKGRTFDILGRRIELSENGLPRAVLSFFGPNNQRLTGKPQPVLSEGFRLVIETSTGKVIHLKSGKIDFYRETPSALGWTVKSTSDEVELLLEGNAEFDGFIGYTVKLNPLRDVNVEDIRLEIPITRKMSQFMMGMGKEGGVRPEKRSWKWDVKNKSQDAVWVGGVNGGLRIKLKDANYHRQLINIYYRFNPLSLPGSWANRGEGGVDILTVSSGALIRAYSGRRLLRKAEELQFNFDLLITPVKLIDKQVQYNDRYYHNAGTQVCDEFISNAQRSGANIINIHHRKDLNPFINYPYLDENVPRLKRFAAEAHAKGIRTKVYYTTRELTVNMPEIWALRSLGGEVVFPGPGKDAKTVINRNGPHPWLIENFKDDFIPAWKCDFNAGPYKGRQDLSVITTPDSRLNNFYLEGLQWMCRNIDIDGMYIDDSALDRVTMKRARKILDRSRPAARIDLHTWNHFNKMAGWACCLNLYMDLLPYFDQLWIGEGRSYDRSPDYWLVETSGIPFGLTSQMLQGGGNRWRGMVFGITNRLGWHGPTPEHIWKFWDTHEFGERHMIGFWDPNCPVTTDSADLVATVFRGKNDAVIAVANWSDKPVDGRISVDWVNLGIDPDSHRAFLPRIPEFQHERSVDLREHVVVEEKKGFVIVLEPGLPQERSDG